MKELLNENMEQLHFSNDPQQCVKHINQFVENATKNNIKDVLKPNAIESDTQLIIVNAVYFKGQWVCVRCTINFSF